MAQAQSMTDVLARMVDGARGKCARFAIVDKRLSLLHLGNLRNYRSVTFKGSLLS